VSDNSSFSGRTPSSNNYGESSRYSSSSSTLSQMSLAQPREYQSTSFGRSLLDGPGAVQRDHQQQQSMNSLIPTTVTQAFFMNGGTDYAEQTPVDKLNSIQHLSTMPIAAGSQFLCCNSAMPTVVPSAQERFLSKVAQNTLIPFKSRWHK
jgi:hypothetical protein